MKKGQEAADGSWDETLVYPFSADTNGVQNSELNATMSEQRYELRREGAPERAG